MPRQPVAPAAPSVQAPSAESSAPASVAPLDVLAFERATVWVEPVAIEVEPDPPAAPPASTPPIRLELLAVIVRTGADPPTPERLAAIYDSERDRVRVVGSGERIGRFNIMSVDDRSVTVTDGQQLTVLRLPVGDQTKGDQS